MVAGEVGRDEGARVSALEAACAVGNTHMNEHAPESSPSLPATKTFPALSQLSSFLPSDLPQRYRGTTRGFGGETQLARQNEGDAPLPGLT